MNFGAQRSRFSHLLMELKMFGIKTAMQNPLFHSYRTFPGSQDSSGITSSISTGLFPPPSLGHCTSLALLWGSLPTSPWFHPLRCQHSTDVPPGSGTGTRRAEGMAPYEQGICLQLVCPSATAPALSRWAPAPGALREREGTGTWRVMRSAECWMQMCGSQLEIHEGM